jgi:hypothetical protein
MARGNPGRKRSRATFQAILRILDILKIPVGLRSDDQQDAVAAIPRQTLATWITKEEHYRAQTLKGKRRSLHKGSVLYYSLYILGRRSTVPIELEVQIVDLILELRASFIPVDLGTVVKIVTAQFPQFDALKPTAASKHSYMKRCLRRNNLTRRRVSTRLRPAILADMASLKDQYGVYLKARIDDICIIHGVEKEDVILINAYDPVKNCHV